MKSSEVQSFDEWYSGFCQGKDSLTSIHPKPFRQGTCLGLSLSCDIVKTHGGELMVKTKEGEGIAFKNLIFNM